MNNIKFFNKFSIFKKSKNLFIRRKGFSTFLYSQNPSAIKALDLIIDSLSPSLTSDDNNYGSNVVVVLASKNYDSKELELIPNYLYSSKIKPGILIGCVVDKILTSSSHDGNFNWKNGLAMYITMERKRKKLKIEKELETKLFDLNMFQSISTIPNKFELPDELKSLKQATDSSPDFFLLISDSEPYYFFESLDHHFPNRLVGLAITTSTSTSSLPVNKKPQLDILHQSLCPIGNIILELNGKNPTKLFLQNLQQSNYDDNDKKYSKETDFYLGIYDDVFQNEKSIEIKKILSGDPAKENMAIDTIKDLKVGQYVKFFYVKKNQRKSILNNEYEKKFVLTKEKNEIKKMIFKYQSDELDDINNDKEKGDGGDNNIVYNNCFGATT
ncbi:734_t:CDS:2 [Entrophospora sp. SA101]|nr:734_t:CDS:2 [Entrophospora sp. SA101]